MKCAFCQNEAEFEAAVKLLKFTAKMCDKCYESFADKKTGKKIKDPERKRKE